MFVYLKTADSAHKGVLLSVTRHWYFVCVPGYKTKPHTEKEGVVTIDIQDVGATRKDRRVFNWVSVSEPHLIVLTCEPHTICG